MATGTTVQSRCLICAKEKATSKCSGCLQDYCFNHLVEHRQELVKQLDDLENQRNIFRENFSEQTMMSRRKHVLIEQIDRWGQESIEKIQRTVEETKQLLTSYTNEHVMKIEAKLVRLTEELKQTRQEEDFNEIELNGLRKKLTELEEKLSQSAHISIDQDCSSFINKISLSNFSVQILTEKIPVDAKWIQNGTTVAGGNGEGDRLNQLRKSSSVYVDNDQTIYVTDRENHRIVEWKKGATVGRVIAGGNGQGNGNHQLNGPRDVIVDEENDALIICDRGNQRVVRWPRRTNAVGETIIPNIDCFGVVLSNDGYLYVSDISKNEVKRWKIGEINGQIIAGGNGKGNRLDQLDRPWYIFVDADHSVYVSDYANHRVMKWMKNATQGIVVAGGQGQGNRLSQLSYAGGIIVDQLGTVYVADYCNHRVMRWLKGAHQGNVVVGGNGEGTKANQFSYPSGLSTDRQNNLYVVDFGNHRVQKFGIKSNSNS